MINDSLTKYRDEQGLVVLTSREMANAMHFAFVDVIKTGKTAAAATRQLAVNMYMDDAYKLVAIPYDNDSTEKMTFDTYYAWLSYAVEELAGMSDTLTSSLSNFMKIVELSVKGLLRYPDGEEITVEDLLDLREGHMQKVASAINRILRADPEYPDLDKAGEIVALALDPETTGDDLTHVLREQGLSNPRSAAVEVKTATYNKKTVYFIETDDDLTKAKVELILGNRVNWSTSTPEEIAAEIYVWSTPVITVDIDPDFKPDIEPITESDDTIDMEEYLRSMTV